MAIVKMKKLRVVAMAEQRDELLRGLLHLGCVEISEPDGKLADPAWSALLKRGTSDLAKVRTELADANTALDAIKRYGQTKDGLFVQRFSVSEQEFLDPDSRARAKELSAGIGGALQEISRLQGEENRLLAREAALRPWMSLDMPLELEERNTCCSGWAPVPVPRTPALCGQPWLLPTRRWRYMRSTRINSRSTIF